MVFLQFPGFQRFYESCLSGLRTTVHCKTSSRWIPSKHDVNMASTWILYDSIYIYSTAKYEVKLMLVAFGNY